MKMKVMILITTINSINKLHMISITQLPSTITECTWPPSMLTESLSSAPTRHHTNFSQYKVTAITQKLSPQKIPLNMIHSYISTIKAVNFCHTESQISSQLKQK